ncbi:MAG: PD40 domain-containing protein [Bacteroidetes bacterium]|nr:PD40 domain-containing protein [Bacteroidota bacterium]MBI3482330.1 PD40 domain-containing protein [Bacteroidota bacterium]
MAEGDRFHSKKKYRDAIAVFKKALDINPDDALVNFKLGLAYLYSDTKSKAAGFIDKAYRLNPKIDNRIDYHLGTAFQNRNDFKNAIEHFKAFGENNPNLSTIARERINECLIADSLVQNELNVVIENLGRVVNSTQDEYSPIISSDGNMLIFTSNRGELIKNQPHHEEIYVAHKKGNVWGEPKKLGPTINTEFNDAAASLSPDGKTMFLYYEDNGGDIYASTFDGKDWGKPVPLNKNINTSQFQETCASMSPDGKKLYFASNRPDGFGELDIYVSELDNKGQWGKGVNLGPLVNTPGNDDSPYIHYDGVTLYFSSDGHPKIGNSDIFVTEFKKGNWTKPENIGYPINSWEYDGFFSISPDKKTAYYATVKEGDNGGIDIYSIKFLEPKFKPKPKPVVVEEPKKPAPKKEEFHDPLIDKLKQQKVFTLLKGKVIDETDAHALEATITLVDNETGKIISKLTSDPASGEFELIIPHGGNYGVATERQGYLFNSINFNLPKFAEYQEIDTHVIMAPAEVGSKAVLKNIFFDVGKSELKTQSLAEVEKILELLKSNEHLKVQINGHTDNTGNATMNKSLSLKRASSVVDYLISKGVDASRVSAKGFGSERPIVSNDDEEGGREINRRTEIEIISAG